MASLPRNKREISHDRIYDVPLSMVKLANYNPPNRDKALNNLKGSIERIGQIQPATLTLNPFCEISDGHRRCFALKSLGYKTVKAIFIPQRVNSSVAYADVNNTVKKTFFDRCHLQVFDESNVRRRQTTGRTNKYRKFNR